MKRMVRADIQAYYERGGEWDRLVAGTGRLEFLRTWDVLTRVLPEAPAEVLDVGGATGVYAGPLATVGYRVHLVDPVPSHVAAAAALPGVTATEGDARALPVPDASVDAVLLFGPLYHLSEREDRLAAWSEARRVLRPGGVVVGAVISRFASLLDGVAKGYFAEPGFAGLVEGALADGVHRNDDNQLPWFTRAYFHRPEEAAAEAVAAGFAEARTVAVEGPFWMAASQLTSLLASPEHTATVLDMLRRVEDEPSMFGASSHLLTIAHR